MTNKMTKRDYFKMAIAETNNEELKAFFTREIELLEKKAMRSANALRKPTKTQIANEEIKANILDYLRENTNATISEIKDYFNLTSQKVTPLVNALVTENKATKIVEKRVAYYTAI